MKTGKQVFEDILNQIDRSISVSSILDETETTITVKVCKTKWIRSGQIVTFNEEEISVLSVNITDNTVVLSLPENQLKVNSKIILQKPTFLSGTPRNVEGENKLRDSAGVPLVMPIVWLLESVDGQDLGIMDYFAKTFNFTFFCLEMFNGIDWLNDDRHRECVDPMTQLKDEIIKTIDASGEFERTGQTNFNEFSRFGSDSEQGFRAYILNLNLSGVECRLSVNADRDSCDC